MQEGPGRPAALVRLDGRSRLADPLPAFLPSLEALSARPEWLAHGPHPLSIVHVQCVEHELEGGVGLGPVLNPETVNHQPTRTVLRFDDRGLASQIPVTHQ